MSNAGRETDREQVLALAAVFQSALLADQVASTGMVNEEAAAPVLNAVLALDTSGGASEIYPDAGELRAGLRLLQSALNGGQRPDSMRAISYALSLVQLASFLRRNDDLVSVLRHRLDALAGQESSSLAGHSFADRCQRFAGVYVDTLGTLKFRIRVQGDPRHLQNDQHASAIRALFLGGVRAAFLWHASGGRRWQLLFSRRRLLAELQSLLAEN